ncbi:MAG: hypothetical protein HYV09_30720 [Deltaproteobacteria bacterium]|nr:hypothetical protein [Deltaproteobacteria bacterium]
MDRHALAIGHGVFDVITGLWPIAHLRSFEAVTGPKLEGWLVKTTGALIAGVGATLALAGARRRVTPEIATLATATTAGLAAIELIYAGARRRISPIYLLDAAVEIALLAAWANAARRGLDDASAERAPREHVDAAARPSGADIW